MNALYLGHYREDTDLGSSSRRFIHGLIKKDINLAVRPLYHFRNNTFRLTDQDILKVENAEYNNYDCVFQHTIPVNFCYNKSLGKNIGILDIQTINTQYGSMIDYINLMDKVYLRSSYGIKHLKKYAKNTSIDIIPEPFDSIDNTYVKNDDEYRFYAKGNTDNHYNLFKVIVAFLSEFSNETIPQLILYMNDDESKITNMLNKAYKKLNIKAHTSEKIVVVNNKFDEQEEENIIRNAHCAINIDKADSSAIFTIKNLLYKNIIITQKESASCYYVNDNNAILAESYPTNVEDMANAYDNSIYSIYEKWYDTDINSLKSCMRNAYCLSENEIKSKQCHINTNLFSYNKFCETIP